MDSAARGGSGGWGGEASFLAAFGVAKLALHLAFVRGYGYFRDELYYLACAEHPAWGYVDHPPLSVMLLWATRLILGDSLPALRLLPALAGAVTVVLTGTICRRLGGGRFAQALAMTAVIVAPYFLFVNHVYSMNAFDLLVWTLAASILVRIFAGGSPSLWLALGVVLGLGLQNKISVLWLGLGLVIGLRLSPQRGWVMTRWPWLAAGLAFLIFLPNVLWQVAHGWPTVAFMTNALAIKMAAIGPLSFMGEQVLLLHPLSLPIWGGGLVFLLFAKDGRRFRALGILYLTVLVLLLATRGSRPGYLAPAYPMLLAAGGVAAERALARGALRRLRAAALALLVVGGAALAPFGLPVLPVDAYVRGSAALGLAPRTNERKALAALPQHYADMFGWDAIVSQIAAARDRLPPDERATAGVFVQNYGEAGAVDFFGPKLGLPRATCGHNTYWLWGPPEPSPEAWIVVGGDEEGNRAVCRDLERAGTIDCGHCMPYENGQPIWICRGLEPPMRELWPRLRHFQ